MQIALEPIVKLFFDNAMVTEDTYPSPPHVSLNETSEISPCQLCRMKYSSGNMIPAHRLWFLWVIDSRLSSGADKVQCAKGTSSVLRTCIDPDAIAQPDEGTDGGRPNPHLEQKQGCENEWRFQKAVG